MLAHPQVVNGLLYQLTLEVAETNCSREEPPSVEESCVPGEDAERRFFDLTLLVQPHRNHSELTQVEDAAWVLVINVALGQCHPEAVLVITPAPPYPQ